MTGQWADTLAGLEKLFYLKLVLWGALSALLGSLLLLHSKRIASPAPLIGSLAVTLLLAGSLEVMAALMGRQAVPFRDLDAATTLDRTLWLVGGVAIGWASVAIVVAVLAWRRVAESERAAIVGICLGIALHGTAIALLCLQLGTHLVR